MPTIVDPAVQLGGAWTATRAIVNLLRVAPFGAEVVVVRSPVRSWTAHRVRRYVALGQSLVSGRPAKFQFSYSREMLAEMNRLVAEKTFDLILLNGSDLLWMLPHLPAGVPQVLLAHNIEHLLYADQIEDRFPKAGLRKSWLKQDGERLRQHEHAGMQTVGNVLFLSREEEAYARRECPGLRTITVPPLFEAGAVRRPAALDSIDDGGVMEIGMLANFEWWPPQQGLRWFLREVFPQVKGPVRLHLFGKRSQDVTPDDERIVKHGYAPELDAVWSMCHFMICPVLAGTGVSIKLAEAVCRGVPVLATRYATRGLPLEADAAIVLREAAEEWVEFLNSGAARELRWRSPAPHLAERFHPQSHVAGITEFLRQAGVLKAGCDRKNGPPGGKSPSGPVGQ